MKSATKVTLDEDITLISLLDSPINNASVAEIFRMISDENIDVDMISQTLPNGSNPSLSFTVSDNDFVKVLSISSKLREKHKDLKIKVISGNCKISIFNENMKGTPGIASKVFDALEKTNANVYMITTSEVDMSVLIGKAQNEEVLNEIKNSILS
ncbi:MAG: ACT domain-containing protein [Clostridiales bacterium]|nr:ACT domain-containing protein [Clostridiales bacterium]